MRAIRNMLSQPALIDQARDGKLGGEHGDRVAVGLKVTWAKFNLEVAHGKVRVVESLDRANYCRILWFGEFEINLGLPLRNDPESNVLMGDRGVVGITKPHRGDSHQYHPGNSKWPVALWVRLRFLPVARG